MEKQATKNHGKDLLKFQLLAMKVSRFLLVLMRICAKHYFLAQ
jgi:hypothetical protein